MQKLPKTSTTKTRATHNLHNGDRRYNIPLNLLPVATGCKVHYGRLGTLWVRGCFVTKTGRMYCSDTRVGEWKLVGPILRSIRGGKSFTIFKNVRKLGK
jgi:hypothetical protein